MAIIDLQRRQTEVGRIRLGDKTVTKTGKTAPTRLETFRFTSPSKPLIEAVAGLYGGKVEPWPPPHGPEQWEVITDTAVIPVVVPPQDVESSQFYELWSKGGVQRRCTGQRELISDSPCICDPTERDCSMHTRVNLMLRDVPGIGVWRLDTGGYYAATELPGMVALLSQARGMVEASLQLVQRSVTRGGTTKTFPVPVLHVESFTPGQLIAGTASVGPALDGGQRQAVAGPEQRAALPSASAAAPTSPAPVGEDWPASIRLAATKAQLDQVGERIAADPMASRSEALRTLWKQRAAELKAQAEPASDATAPSTVDNDEQEPDPDEMWNGALAAAGRLGWTTAQTQQTFTDRYGKQVHEASGWELQDYRDKLKAEPAGATA